MEREKQKQLEKERADAEAEEMRKAQEEADKLAKAAAGGEPEGELALMRSKFVRRMLLVIYLRNLLSGLLLGNLLTSGYNRRLDCQFVESAQRGTIV